MQLYEYSPHEVYMAVGERIRTWITMSGGTFFLGLSGGETSAGLCRYLATCVSNLDWSRVRIGFADERAVPPDHADSNYRLVRDGLLTPLRIPASHVVRIRAEAPDLEAAALEYEAVLTEPFDLLILGIGPDGHTASIFPRSRAARETERRVVAVEDSPKPPGRRITVTPRVIREARRVIVMAQGGNKAAAVARGLAPDTDPVEFPAALARDREWIVDHAAAGRVGRSDA